MLETDRLTVSLSGRSVLRDVTCRAEPGTLTALVGPNGSGKTTLLRTLAGLLPHEGTARLDGKAARDWSARDRAQRLAFVRQTQPVAFDVTVRQFVLLGRAPHRGWLEPFIASDREAAERAIEAVGLAELADRPMPRLSGGEQQRARLAQALAQDTSVLLLDEPTAHLDLHHQFGLMERLAAMAHDGRTVVAALHDLTLAARFADRLAVLHDGRLVASGPPRDVLSPDRLRAVFQIDAALAPGTPLSLTLFGPASPLPA